MPAPKKIALVAGASRGIGRATAKTLAAAGAHVIAHHGASAAEAESLVHRDLARTTRVRMVMDFLIDLHKREVKTLRGA